MRLLTSLLLLAALLLVSGCDYDRETRTLTVDGVEIQVREL